MASSKLEYFVPSSIGDDRSQCKPPRYGPQCIEQFASALIQNTTGRVKSLGRQWLVSKPLTIGTMCSGSDSPILVARSICSAFNREMPNDQQCAEAQHLFSVEMNQKKQHFIRQMFPELPRLYENTASMADPLVFDLITQTFTQPPAVRFLIAGFPCTDVSRLNNLAQLNRGTVKQQDKRTGTCFRGIVNYCKLHSDTLEILILENVLGLATLGIGRDETDLQTCLNVLEHELNFSVVVWRLDPRIFGWPQSRPRLWFLAVNNKLGLPSALLKSSMKGWMDRFASGWDLADLDETLLHPLHPYILMLHSSYAHARAVAQPTPKRAKSFKWLEKHAMHADWWRYSLSATTLSEHVGLQALTERELDVLVLSGFEVPQPFKLGRRPNLLDVSQSEGRCDSRSDGVSPCIVPRCKIVHSSQARVLSGVDCMHLQGICYGEGQYDLFTQLNDDVLLKDLAGNAFNCHCCTAVMVTSIFALGELFDVAVANTLALPAPSIVSEPVQVSELSASDMVSLIMDFSSDEDV